MSNKRWTPGGSFDLCRPRSVAGLAAEARFNSSVVRGRGDETALRALVEDHVRTYPYGIDPGHQRAAPPVERVNGFDHRADYEAAKDAASKAAE